MGKTQCGRKFSTNEEILSQYSLIQIFMNFKSHILHSTIIRHSTLNYVTKNHMFIKKVLFGYCIRLCMYTDIQTV